MLIPAPFQNSAQPIVFVSAAGVIKDCNQALSELLGFHRLELLNKSITFLIHYPRELFQDTSVQDVLKIRA
ncbi:MAG: PAS domain-containing protein [Bacteroidetes bacterium]|nr:PAS domain-containing protein [Bacteroidota bacterium]